ncbi:MAG: twin-arginine translocase TatA/TatE family subunit [Microgenomates group bacterium]
MEKLFKNIGGTEIIVIAIVLLVLFGGKKLPELARGLGESIKEFRKAFKSDEKKTEETE